MWGGSGQPPAPSSSLFACSPEVPLFLGEIAAFSARFPISVGIGQVLPYMHLLLKCFWNVSQLLRVQMHFKLAEPTLCLQGTVQRSSTDESELPVINKFLQLIQSVIHPQASPPPAAPHHYLFQPQPQEPLIFKSYLRGRLPHANVSEYLPDSSESHPRPPTL